MTSRRCAYSGNVALDQTVAGARKRKAPPVSRCPLGRLCYRTIPAPRGSDFVIPAPCVGGTAAQFSRVARHLETLAPIGMLVAHALSRRRLDRHRHPRQALRPRPRHARLLPHLSARLRGVAAGVDQGARRRLPRGRMKLLTCRAAKGGARHSRSPRRGGAANVGQLAGFFAGRPRHVPTLAPLSVRKSLGMARPGGGMAPLSLGQPGAATKT
jgi:hypothetical protein